MHTFLFTYQHTSMRKISYFFSMQVLVSYQEALLKVTLIVRGGDVSAEIVYFHGSQRKKTYLWISSAACRSERWNIALKWFWLQLGKNQLSMIWGGCWDISCMHKLHFLLIISMLWTLEEGYNIKPVKNSHKTSQSINTLLLFVLYCWGWEEKAVNLLF